MTGIPAVLCVDVEPDPREVPDDAPRSWPGFESLLADDRWLRAAMSPTGHAPLTWCVRIDPAIATSYGSACFVAERWGGPLGRLEAGGDELGLHPHNWRRDERGWVADGTDSWVLECIETALAGFTQAFGRPCRTHRFGDRFMSQVLANALAASSVVVDLTLEPGGPAERSPAPTFRALGLVPHVDPALSAPFQPSTDHFQLPAPPDGSLTMVPLTSAAIPGSPSVQTVALWRPPAEFELMLRSRLRDPALTHLAFAIRSDMALHPTWRPWIEQNLARVAALRPDVAWTTGERLADLVTDDGGRAAPGVVGTLATDVMTLLDQLDESRLRQERTGARLAELEVALASIEATATWRARRRALPVLRRIDQLRGRFRGLAGPPLRSDGPSDPTRGTS